MPGASTCVNNCHIMTYVDFGALGVRQIGSRWRARGVRLPLWQEESGTGTFGVTPDGVTP